MHFKVVTVMHTIVFSLKLSFRERHISCAEKCRHISVIIRISCISQGYVETAFFVIIPEAALHLSKCLYLFARLLACNFCKKHWKLISADSADNRIPTEILSHILRQFLQGKISRSMTVYIIDEFKIVDIHLYRHAWDFRIVFNKWLSLLWKSVSVQKTCQWIYWRHSFKILTMPF